MKMPYSATNSFINRKREIPVRGRKRCFLLLQYISNYHRKREIPVRGRKQETTEQKETTEAIEKEKSP